MDNKVITSQGNVQFQFPDGKIVNVHPNHIYTVFNEDTVNFVLVGLPKSSGLAMMASKAEDLEVNGQKYTIDELPSVLEEAFAEAGAQARCEIVDELPETGYTNTIYLVPQPAPQTGFDEYVYILDQGWELIGDTSIEMDNYVLKTVFSGYTADTAVIINNEISARTQGDIALNAKIDQEIVDRASDVDAEEARATSAETALQTAIDDEISARTDADTAEQTAREAADSFISGAVSDLSTAIANEVQRAQNAESGLSDSIDAEATSREAADEALSGAVDTVSGNLNDEISRATSAETALQTAIDGLEEEKASYIYVDAQLQTKTDNTTFDAFVADFEAYSGNVATALGEKASQSDLTTLSGNVTAHIDDSSIHLTSGDVQTQIDNAIADKLDVNSFEAYSAETDARIAENEEVTAAALNTINDRLSEDEEVTSAALNDLNESLSGKADSSDVYTKIEVDDALVGKVNTSDFETYSGTVETALAQKQNQLVAGENITISGNVISSEGGGKAIEAGRGISITTGETVDTVSFNLPMSAGTGNYSIIEGRGGQASGVSSHAEGRQTQASGDYSHAEGRATQAIGQSSHSEGYSTTASTDYSHAEGRATQAIGVSSHAEGEETQANGNFSHSEGYVTITKNSSEHASGQYNNSVSASTTFGDSGNTLFSVGNGTANNARHNAFEIRQNGDIYITLDGQDVKLQDQLGGGGGEVSSAITSGDTNAVAGGAVFDAVVYSGNTYTTELTFDADGYAENWVVGQSAITIDVSGYTGTTTAHYHFEDSNGVDLGRANISKNIYSFFTTWSNSAYNCTITTDGDTATTATITDIPSGTVKVRRTDESNPPKAIISGDTPETWIKDALDEHRDNTTVHITNAERSSWNNKSNFSGSYNDLTDVPIPDSALNVASTNPVQNQALYSELRIDDGSGETETTLVFENNYSTNYPSGCTKLIVEVVGSNNSSVVEFYGNDYPSLGSISVLNWGGSITVDNSFDGATYEISGTTVIITYPTVTNVEKIQLGNSDYVYKAVTTSTTPLKDQVVANTTALGGLSLVMLTQAEYDSLATKDNSTLYVIVG